MNSLDRFIDHLDDGQQPFGPWTDGIRLLVAVAAAATHVCGGWQHREDMTELVAHLDRALAPLLQETSDVS